MMHNTRFPSEQHIGARNKSVFHTPNTHVIEGMANHNEGKANHKTAIKAVYFRKEKSN